MEQKTWCILVVALGAVIVVPIEGTSSVQNNGQGECKTKEQCPENQYCGGRGAKKRCIECVNCGDVKREPKTQYDGETCATHKSQCGQCLPGYEDLGGMCYPSSFQGQGFMSGLGSEGVEKVPEIPPKAGDENDARIAHVSYIVIVILLVVMFVVVFALIVTKLLRPKTGTRLEEETGLTGSVAPTAPPPDEYGIQPPYIHNNCELGKPQQGLPRRITDNKARARPFNVGNGAGDWEITDDDDMDTVDGAVGSTAEEHNIDNRSQLPPVEPTSRTIPISSQVTQPPTFRTSNDIVPDNGNPDQPTFHQGNNPVLAQFYMHQSFGLFIGGQPRFATANTNPEPQTRQITSAPTSPGRIDDTVVCDLTQLSGMFESSSSLDSGTGTNDNDHDRSVPSRTVSGTGFSDMELEESML